MFALRGDSGGGGGRRRAGGRSYSNSIRYSGSARSRSNAYHARCFGSLGLHRYVESYPGRWTDESSPGPSRVPGVFVADFARRAPDEGSPRSRPRSNSRRPSSRREFERRPRGSPSCTASRLRRNQPPRVPRRFEPLLRDAFEVARRSRRVFPDRQILDGGRRDAAATAFSATPPRRRTSTEGVCCARVTLVTRNPSVDSRWSFER